MQINSAFTINRFVECFIGCWERNLGLRGTREQGSGKDCIVRSFMICIHHQKLFRRSNQEQWDGWGMWHAWKTRLVHIQFWWRDLWKRDHLKGLTVDVRIILKCTFKGWDGEVWTGLIWLRTGTFGCHKMQGISWLAEKLLACQEGLPHGVTCFTLGT